MEDTHGWVFYVHLFGNVMQAGRTTFKSPLLFCFFHFFPVAQFFISCHFFCLYVYSATILEDYDLALSIEKETDVKYMDGIYGWYDFMTWKSILFMVSIPAAINQGVPPTVCEKKNKSERGEEVI